MTDEPEKEIAVKVEQLENYLHEREHRFANIQQTQLNTLTFQIDRLVKIFDGSFGVKGLPERVALLEANAVSITENVKNLTADIKDLQTIFKRVSVSVIGTLVAVVTMMAMSWFK